MRGKRIFLNKNDTLHLGAITYTIMELVGYGESAVVYKAYYYDNLNANTKHYVLIKELFPYHINGEIYRDENKQIVCHKTQEVLFDLHKQYFYQGNNINLKLLGEIPEHISGNINSYEAYGSIYSILVLHGGMNLEDYLEARNVSLLEATEILIRIIEAIEYFHNAGYLHMDISTDNILITENQVLLIDYNGIWPINKDKDHVLHYSYKKGYSAPEYRLQDMREIGISTEIYSICAIYFRILFDRIISENEIRKLDCQKLLSQELEIWKDVPSSAIYKVMQILQKGLHIIARKRYQRTIELKEDLYEVINRIQGLGFTHSALWENTQRLRMSINHTDSHYIELDFRTEGDVLNRHQLFRNIQAGEKYLLIGTGGSGKTTYLRQLLEEQGPIYNKNRPAICYISLQEYQISGQKEHYIFYKLIESFSNPLFDKGMNVSHDVLKLQFNKMIKKFEEDGAHIILLLDGLNEAGNHTKELLQEIEWICQYSNIGIVITDRTENVKSYAIKNINTIEIQGVSQKLVELYLGHYHMGIPQDTQLLQLLKNPMLLHLYREIIVLDKDMIENQIFSEEKMMEYYIQSLKLREQKNHAGNEKEQLAMSYVMDFLLRLIAQTMIRKKKSVLTKEEVYQLCEIHYTQLYQKKFQLIFPEYLGKSRIMLKDIQHVAEWYDYCICEVLTERLHLIEHNQEGYIRFIHDNYLAFFYGQYLQKKKKLNKIARYGKKKYVWCAIGASVLLITFGIAHTYIGGNDISQEEQLAIDNVADTIIGNIGTLDIQLQLQLDVLEKADATDVLEGDSEARAELLEYIQYTEEQLEKYTLIVSSDNSWLDSYNLGNMDISTANIQELLQKPIEMDGIALTHLEHLEETLGQESAYNTIEKSQPLVDTYQEYLDTYAALTYLELQNLLLQLPEETVKEIEGSLIYMSVLSDYMISGTYSYSDQDELEQKIIYYEEELKDCVVDMKLQNYE